VREPDGAGEAQFAGTLGKTRGAYVIAEMILFPGDLGGRGRDVEFRIEHGLVAIVARPQHHAVFAESDRIAVAVRGYMANREDRHGIPDDSLWVPCIY